MLANLYLKTLPNITRNLVGISKGNSRQIWCHMKIAEIITQCKTGVKERTTTTLVTAGELEAAMKAIVVSETAITIIRI